LNKFQ